MPRTLPHPLRLLAGALLLASAACTDTSPLAPRGPEPAAPPRGAPPTTLQALDCTAVVAERTVACAAASPAAGEAAPIIVGGQNVYVTLASSNVAYNGGTGQFTMDVTLQNLIEQPMGTADGVTPDPAGIRIFFSEGPTVTAGTGSAAVVPDGFAFFLAAGQPFYQYDGIVGQNQVTAAEPWTFIVSPTVTTFGFRVYVSAPVPFPAGYVTLSGLMPGSPAGSLAPGATQLLTPVVKTAVGNVVAGETVTFATGDPGCAVVDAESGVVTAVQAATCTITATAGARSGAVSFQVTGATRAWGGTVSADWSTPGNWVLGRVPVALDSVWIPAAAANQPALVGPVQVAGVGVQDGAVLSLGAFVLTADADVATGYGGGSGILAAGGELRLAGTGTVAGRVPTLRVTGDYALGGDLQVVAPERIDAGRLLLVNYLMQILSQ
jgi:hypothetical protein